MKADATAAALWDRLPARSQALCAEAAQAGEALGGAVYLVGGSVRDLLLGGSQVDLDVVVVGDALAVAAAVAARRGATVRSPSEFLTTAIDIPGGGHLDLATARQETYPAPAKLPEVSRAGIEEDLRRRDFSVNAMALRLTADGAADLVDPCGGREDLAAGLIRILHPRSLMDDPTRIIRAARFEQRLGFALEPVTEVALRDAVRQGLLEQVTGPRVRDELVKLLAEPDPCRPLARLQELGALSRALPGVHFDEVAAQWLRWAPAAVAALGVPGRAWTFLLGALCARGDTDRATERLRLDAAAQSVVQAMARAAGSPLPRLLGGRAGMRDSQVAGALEPGANGERVLYWLRGNAVARRRLERDAAVLRNMRSDIDGNDLQAEGVPPGRAIGVGLRAARNAKLNGQADRDAQARAAVAAIAEWARPGRRLRTRV
jgi:tRNA nucleotidyltransferase (CCA-adding enzyme)